MMIIDALIPVDTYAKLLKMETNNLNICGSSAEKNAIFHIIIIPGKYSLVMVFRFICHPSSRRTAVMSIKESVPAVRSSPHCVIGPISDENGISGLHDAVCSLKCA